MLAMDDAPLQDGDHTIATYMVPPDAAMPQLRGVVVIETALLTMPQAPGVYRMLDAKGEALYVGKARSLKKRVTSYTQIGRLPERLRRMVTDTVSMEVVTTHTEAEALLLEANLIKRLRPRFNIVLRDDKSYPWLMLAEDHPFPQITKHRGSQSQARQLLGAVCQRLGCEPDSDGHGARLSASVLCRYSVFANRSRPCLLHQIKRCSAPCVGKIDARGLREAGRRRPKRFLTGKAAHVQRDLSAEMAVGGGKYRIRASSGAARPDPCALTHVQGSSDHQSCQPRGCGHHRCLAERRRQSCVQVFFVRGGRNNGNRAHYPRHIRRVMNRQMF